MRVKELIKKRRTEKNKEDKNNKKETWQELSPELALNVKYLKDTLGQSDDVIFREYTVQLGRPLQIMLIFIDGMSSKEIINKYILEALTLDSDMKAEWERKFGEEDLVLAVRDRLLTIDEVKVVTTYPEIMAAVLSGETAILFEGEAQAIIANTRGWEHRGIDEPQTESVVRDRWYAQGQTIHHRATRREPDAPGFGKEDVRGGAADVADQRVTLAGQPACPGDRCGGTGKDRLDRPLAGQPRRNQRPVAAHHHQRRVDAERGHMPLAGADQPVDHPDQARVQERGQRPTRAVQAGRQFVRTGHRQARDAADRIARGVFMGGVAGGKGGGDGKAGDFGRKPGDFSL